MRIHVPGVILIVDDVTNVEHLRCGLLVLGMSTTKERVVRQLIIGDLLKVTV